MNNEVIYNKVTFSEIFDFPLEFQLPGYGEPYEWCGTYRYIGHFSHSYNEWHVLRRKRSCHRFECPVCKDDWRKRAVMDAIDRFDVMSELHPRIRYNHFILSPPQDSDYSLQSTFKSMRKQAYMLSKQLGIKGGYVIFHERALRYTDTTTYTNNHCGSGGPHFHIVGHGWATNVKEVYDSTGWIVKNKGRRRSLYKTLDYLLDHAVRAILPIRQTRNQLKTETWFGDMSYNMLKNPEKYGVETIYCPICNDEIETPSWYLLTSNGQKPPPDTSHFILQNYESEFIDYTPLTAKFGFEQ